MKDEEILPWPSLFAGVVAIAIVFGIFAYTTEGHVPSFSIPIAHGEIVNNSLKIIFTDDVIVEEISLRVGDKEYVVSKAIGIARKKPLM